MEQNQSYYNFASNLIHFAVFTFITYTFCVKSYYILSYCYRRRKLITFWVTITFCVDYYNWSNRTFPSFSWKIKKWMKEWERKERKDKTRKKRRRELKGRKAKITFTSKHASFNMCKETMQFFLWKSPLIYSRGGIKVKSASGQASAIIRKCIFQRLSDEGTNETNYCLKKLKYN